MTASADRSRSHRSRRRERVPPRGALSALIRAGGRQLQPGHYRELPEGHAVPRLPRQTRWSHWLWKRRASQLQPPLTSWANNGYASCPRRRRSDPTLGQVGQPLCAPRGTRGLRGSQVGRRSAKGQNETQGVCVGRTFPREPETTQVCRRVLTGSRWSTGLAGGHHHTGVILRRGRAVRTNPVGLRRFST